MATPPTTKYQRSNPLSQIAILKKNGSLDSGIQSWYLSTCHMANSGELLYTQCFFKHCFSILWVGAGLVHQHKENTLLYYNISEKKSSRSDWGLNPRPAATMTDSSEVFGHLRSNFPLPFQIILHTYMQNNSTWQFMFWSQSEQRRIISEYQLIHVQDKEVKTLFHSPNLNLSEFLLKSLSHKIQCLAQPFSHSQLIWLALNILFSFLHRHKLSECETRNGRSIVRSPTCLDNYHLHHYLSLHGKFWKHTTKAIIYTLLWFWTFKLFGCADLLLNLGQQDVILVTRSNGFAFFMSPCQDIALKKW
jgi:hypothetical protein